MTDTENLATWVERVAALKHDLAKYVAWRSANFDADAWTGPLSPAFLESLQADLLQTLRGQAAWELWDAQTASWHRPFTHPELAAVEAAVETLRALEEPLRRGDSHRLGTSRAAIAQAQQDIRVGLRDLHRRLQAQLRGGAT